ncbi:MAG: homoserine O-acetyltransferase [Rikenellaceae bacterium]
MGQHNFKYSNRFELESGKVLPELNITYHTFGKLSPKADNIIWVCHALTANSDVSSWWPGTVESGRFLDPNKYFIVCANILGSHYGTTGPLSLNPATGIPYYGSFPRITVRDAIKVHRLLAEYLQIKHVKMLIGSSIGGFQVSEWLIMDPLFAEKAVIIASAPKAEAWVVAFNESQRMAIESDQTYGALSPDAGAKGMATARSIALLSYRCRSGYNNTQSESEDDNYKISDFRASSYQRYQGKKLTDRFNAYSYHRLTEMIDSHNISRGRISMEKALEKVKAKVALVAISSDILYPISSHLEFHKYIKNSTLHILESEFGHDGFLVEHEKLNKIIVNFLETI